MSLHYFPDTNIMLNYFEEFDTENFPLIKEIISKTDKKNLSGYLLSSVKSEFESICREDRISNTVEEAIGILRKSKNKKEFLDSISKIDNYPNERIVSGLIKQKMEAIKEFDVKNIQKSVHYIFVEIKAKRNTLLNGLESTDALERGDTRSKFKSEFDTIAQKLGEWFPIIKENDKHDNLHILKGIICCKAKQIDGYFVTNDNLRNNRLKLEKAISELRSFVSKNIGIKFEIKKLRDFFGLI